MKDVAARYLRRAIVCVLVAAGLVAGSASTGPVAFAATFVVNSTGDSADSNTADGVCDDGTGACTLRAAIQQANASAGPDTINFSIGSGVQTITPLSLLPTVGGPVTIDGTTQPGFAGSPVIELSGAAVVNVGLSISSADNTVKGLVINRFTHAGISIVSAIVSGGNKIEGNFLGTDVTGTIDLGNGYGVYAGSANNTIGGTTATARNIISGNEYGGVLLDSSSNRVEGNFIGTDVTGTIALGNRYYGVYIGSSSNNTIGGATAAARNIISGNEYSGVFLGGGSGNSVLGNFIGTDVTGTGGLANANGVVVDASNTVIRGNTVAFNVYAGVAVFVGGNGNSIISNSIFSTVGSPPLSGLGIELEVEPGDEGVTPNDPGDGDLGANNFQNFPDLTSAVAGAGYAVVQGTLNSTASTEFTVQLFGNSVCDPSGYGEGETLLRTTTVTTDASGNASINVTLSTAVPVGQFITATATDPAGNTSEFSQCRQVIACASAGADTDGDGVADTCDACPSQPGLASNDGCPVAAVGGSVGLLAGPGNPAPKASPPPSRGSLPLAFVGGTAAAALLVLGLTLSVHRRRVRGVRPMTAARRPRHSTPRGSSKSGGVQFQT